MRIYDLQKFCRNGTPLYIYGAGAYGRLVKAYLENLDIDVAAFVVSNKCGQSHQVMDIPVLELDEVRSDGDFIIGVGRIYEGEIIEKLSNIGVTNYFLLSDALMDEIYQNVRFDRPISVKRNFANILLYHRVTERNVDPWNLKVTPRHFEEHIKYIKNNYWIARFEDDWTNINEPFVVVTFDDGYIDNYDIVLPILEKYNVPATIFVSSGYVDTKRLFWWDDLVQLIMNSKSYTDFLEAENADLGRYGKSTEDKIKILNATRDKLKNLLPSQREEIFKKWKENLVDATEDFYHKTDGAMTSEELRKLAKSPLVTIGAHTVTHSMLSVEPQEMQQWEFAESKHRIEEIIHRPVTVMSYPFGSRKDINEFTPTIAKECGYEKAAVNWQGTANQDTDAFLLPRNPQRDCNVDEFSKMLRGTWYMYGDV